MTIPYLENPRHLYRALLREATYLCHPRARDYYISFIRTSFRHQREIGRRLEDDPQACERELKGLPTKHETAQLRRGRKYFYTLQRANNGHTRDLENVIGNTFARSGKRRRKLMENIMRPQNQGEGDNAPETYGDGWEPPERFNDLLKSQSRVSRMLSGRGTGLKVMEKFPELNKAGKPFPQSRKKGLVNKWYALQANKILPPLEESEWLEVYNLSRWWTYEIPQRRKAAKCTSDLESGVENPLSPEYLTKTSPHTNAMSKRVKGLVGDPHKVTPRLLSRMIRRVVLENTPLAVLNPESNRLVCRWESGSQVPPVKSVAAPSQAITLWG